MVKYPNGDLKKYKPIAFWAWNGALQYERLKSQIDEMRENGVGGYFMHARAGLRTEYMSKEWMHCIKTCALYGKQEDMDSWVYDEHGWPSGFVGGMLLEKEEFHDKYLLHTTGIYDAKADYCYRIEEAQLVRVREKERLHPEILEGEYLNIYIKTAVSTVDILNPEVTEAFIENTHEKYEVYFGGKLSEYIRGFFTDEPQYQRYHTAYSDMLPGYLKAHYGVDSFDFLGLLFMKADGYRKFRHIYWSAMQQLMLKNYAEKIYNWCEERGVEFTGHYIEETSLSGQMMCCAGVMPFYEYEHIPGIDWIASWCDNELPPRQAGSVAAQLGKKQVLTEAYASFGWQISPRDLKRITEFQFVNGVNLLCEHLFPYSEAGQAKRDFPAHYSNVNPWVKECKDAYHLYITRLSYLLAESRELVNVAVLHPIRSAYLVFQREEVDGGTELAALDGELMRDIKSLSSRGINYHFLDETILAKHGFTDGAKIGCGNCTYDYLILPHVTNMDKTTEHLLRSYAMAGGKILILGKAPSYLEGEEYSYSYLKGNCSLEEVSMGQPCQVTRANDMIYSSLRELNGRRFLFVVNMSSKNSYDHTIICKEAQSFEELDLETWETRVTDLNVHLEPGASKILFLRKEKMTGEEIDSQIRKKSMSVTVFELDKAQVSFENNYLTMDQVQYSVDGKEFSDFFYCIGLFKKLLQERFTGSIYFRYPFEVREIPDQISLLAECAKAECCWLNEHMIQMAEQSELDPDILCSNITPYVRKGRNTFTMKVDWRESEAVYYALFGENVTESMKNKIVYDCELEPVYLYGKFGVYTDDALEADEDGSVRGKNFYVGKIPRNITEPVEEGLPFFRGKMSVGQTVHLTSKNTILKIPGTWSLADVTVNGQTAGRLLFTDYLDISKFAKIGDNEVEITFTISNRNLLGPHHNAKQMLNVFVSPESFDLGNTWIEGESMLYDERYNLLLLGVNHQ